MAVSEIDYEAELGKYLAKHYVHKSNWLRAAVLGANDGILSTASIAVGVAAANVDRPGVLLASLSGLIAGALSMAAGEYVSVSSQTDIERADIERERQELIHTPEEELDMLAMIWEGRGLKPETARQVAHQLTEHDALAAHVRDELGINDMSQANPIQAAWASGLSFLAGGALPFLVVLFWPLASLSTALYCSSIGFLIALGAVAAKTGGSDIKNAVLRITFWGTVVMGLTGIAGHFFGTLAMS